MVDRTRCYGRRYSVFMLSSAPKGSANRVILLGVTSYLSLGFLRGLASQLVSDGWEVHVVSAPVPSDEQPFAVPGVVLHEVEMAREPSPLADLRSLADWNVLLKEVRPDVVMAGTPKAALLGMLSSAAARVPVRIYQIRGLRLETANGLQRKVLGALEKLTVLLSTERLAVSRSLAERYYALGLASRTCKPITVLGRGSSKGVNVERFAAGEDYERLRGEARQRWGVEGGVPVIGYVGRIHEDKGLRELDEASRLLAAQGFDHRVVVIGRSEGSGLEELLARNPNVILAGRSDAVENEYPGMDIFCLPTHREGFPNVVLEASAAGLPVVTTDATGAVDSIEDGRTGLLYRTGDSAHLAKALGWLLRHPEDTTRMGRAGHAFVAEDYDQAAVTEAVASWLEGIQ